MNAAIEDNTVLANFLDVGNKDLLDKSRNIFSTFFIPIEILSEFLRVPPPHSGVRERFADGIIFDAGFYRRCNTFDPIILGLLKTEKGIDPGEAEAIAQASARNINIILTDDKKCKKLIKEKYSHIRCFGTPFLIALLDLNKYLNDTEVVWKKFQMRSKFKRKDIREGYREAYVFIGMTPPKKVINRKCKGLLP